MSVDLLEVINECVTEDKEDSLSSIGFKLLKAAKEYRKKADQKGEVEPTEEELKIRSLRNAELEGNLAWMNNPSWYRLPLDFRELFLSEIDPLVWSGVYFRNSDFEAKKETILPLLDSSCSIAISRDSKNFRFVSVIASKTQEFDSMSENEFIRYTKDFRSKMVKVYGYSKTKGICVTEV
jgi:hypothetical protein